MSLPPRSAVTDALIGALEAARQAAGYHLDLGANVIVGLRQINDVEAPCVVLTPGRELPAETAGVEGAVNITYSVTGYANRIATVVTAHTEDPVAEWAIVDAIIADLRAAIEGDACALFSVTDSIEYQGATPLYHEAGGEVCGATLIYLATTPYVDHIPGN